MKKATETEIIEEIYMRRNEIISNISRESIDVYLWLKNEYKKINVENNTVFQFIFRSYYRLDSAGLGEKLKNRYFELLNRKENNLGIILDELSKIPTTKNQFTVQYSFATKLIHTIDNNKPIYDNEVAAVIHRTVVGHNVKARIESAKEVYAYLKNLYTELINDGKIKKVITQFRSRFGSDTKNITDQKTLDFLIWSLGKLKRKK
ncbi:MAG: hypothetical protein AAB374_02135 [Patescibacteria group bacterium]